MAKINETILVVKVSELVKDSAEAGSPLSHENIKELEQVIAALAGEAALVEIELASEQ